MACADCENCKADRARYLSDPHQRIASAAGNTPASFEDLRDVVYSGLHTPPQFAEEALNMFFTHLSAGDQSSFNPAGPLPPCLRPYEERAFLSLGGIFTIMTTGAARTKTLMDNWPRIRKWIQHFFYRALARTASPLDAPITNDELLFTRMGPDWTIFSMILAILAHFRLDAGNFPFFKTVLAQDGTFTLVVKLWARIVRSDPSLKSTPAQYYRKATLLLADCLLVMDSPESTLRTQLLSEVNEDVKSIAAFLIMALCNAARMKPSEFSSRAAFLWPSAELIPRLMYGVTCERDQAPVFYNAFFNNPKTNPRPFIVKILKKYTSIHNANNQVNRRLEIIGSVFQLCNTLLICIPPIEFAVGLLDNGILSAYANMIQHPQNFTANELKPAAELLKQNISTLLTHETVITAAKNALNKLERDRREDYLALKNTECALKDAWLYFTGHAFERAILKGIYDVKFRKEDKLSCDSCHVRMNEQKLKKCSGCKYTLYCSQECQLKDWKNHKKSCKSDAQMVEEFKTKADTNHFFAHLVRSDIRRHLPGLNALAQSNPRTRGADATLAYNIDYTVAPPTFAIFPVDDLADLDKNAAEHGHAFNCAAKAELWGFIERTMRAAPREARVVQVSRRGHTDAPFMTFLNIGCHDFMDIRPEVPKTLNAGRPRAVDEKNKVALAVQTDWTDTVMADAIHGRKLSHDEFHVYMERHSQLEFSDQEKTVFERVDDAVRRRSQQSVEPCCRDKSGHSIC
ncbi:hypothetical protein SCHPADRAFT_904995 [Schizopora paradoxa]|uniref:MYND-type domain-containing protein n=1 Tax=Schizopora paradoxa TaxID=27342 RepID=A0A0H2S6T5_9AGAM|nr:hypothetical protein SCHPADRAFT_904995 [Schizopora paradoxa]